MQFFKCLIPVNVAVALDDQTLSGIAPWQFPGADTICHSIPLTILVSFSEQSFDALAQSPVIATLPGAEYSVS